VSGAEWTLVLDDLDARLAQQTRDLDAGRPAEVMAFVPPPGLGTLPAGLADRAKGLLERTELLVERSAEEIAGTRRQLTGAARMRRTAPPRSTSARTAYVDHMA
jgi:hypothetical protein